MIFSPNRRVRDNSTKHTLENVIVTKEVVINIVNFSMVQQTSLSSTEYPQGVNEFLKAGFTMLASEEVRPYRVKESPVQFECKVREVIELGQEGGAGNLVICEVVKMHIDESILDDSGNIDQHKIDLVSRLGGNWYGRPSKGLFEVPKPLTTLGIGVDSIPESIRWSKVLTGNDLGMLGNVEALPTTEEVTYFLHQNVSIKGVISTFDQDKIHLKAQEYLKVNDVISAWKVLLASLNNE